MDERIEAETFEEFSQSVKETLSHFDRREIDKIVESIEKRVDMVIKSGKYRTKY